MNYNTKKLTTGAMIAAVFGALLVINMQTGMVLQGAFIYLFPIPMVAFSARYGLKSSLPVLVVMSLISLMCGTFTTIFYAVSGAIIGMTLGSCIYWKWDMRKTLLLTMAVCALVSILDSVILAELFGQSLAAYIEEARTMTDQVLEQSGLDKAMFEQILTDGYLTRMYIISMIIWGMVQGYATYWISLVILRKLKYPVVKPRPISELVPPKWTGYVALLGFLAFNITYSRPFANELLQNTMQTFGVIGYMYLLFYGAMAAGQYLHRNVGIAKPFAAVITGIVFVVAMMVIMFVGFAYISMTLRNYIAPKDPEERRDWNRNAAPAPAQKQPVHHMPRYDNPADDEDAEDNN